MFLHKAISAVIGKVLYEAKHRNYARRSHTCKYTERITPQCLILATVAVKHALQCYASGERIRITFDADSHKGMSE